MMARPAVVLLAMLGLAAVTRLAAGETPAGDAIREVARLCATTVDIDGKPRCYPNGWSPRLKELARRTAGKDARAIERDTAVETPGELVRLPDGETWAVFRGCRLHSCPEAYAWFLLDRAGERLNIVWRGQQGVKYLGPDADRLRDRKVLELLDSAPP